MKLQCVNYNILKTKYQTLYISVKVHNIHELEPIGISTAVGEQKIILLKFEANGRIKELFIVSFVQIK